MIAKIGKICRNTNGSSISKKKGQDFFFNNVVDRKHHGLLEHITVTFRIDGVSRALTHQLVRHRIASFVQESQRHVTLGADDKVNEFNVEDNFIVPDSIKSDDQADVLYTGALIAIHDCYKKLIDLGIPKQDARFILPNASKASIIMTMNLRSYYNFLVLRLAPDAQWEIRELAQEIQRQLVGMYWFFGEMFPGDDCEDTNEEV